jgi:hypothetical protein
VKCGRATCCRECRSKWAWKHALCLVRSARELPPDFFAVVQREQGQTNAKFGKQSQRFVRALKRRFPELEYCRVSEWCYGVRHDHLLIRASCSLNRLKERASEAAVLAGVRVRVGKVRSIIGSCRYVVKNTKRPDRRP